MAKLLRSPITTVVLFVLAAGLLVFGGIGAAQSAPRIQSADYRAEVVLTNIDTAITEFGQVVEGDDQIITDTMLPYNKDDSLKIGKTYDEVLAVRNVADEDAGGIAQYVRVTVNKYWEDGSGKRVNLDPSLIDLHFVEGNGWTIDEVASTSERTVLYYDKTVAPGADTTPFADKLTISGKVVTAATKLADGTDSFDYENVTFRVKASVDAVQTHNAEDAMTGAWGRTNKG